MLYHRKPLGTVAYMGGVPALLEEFCWSWGQMIQWNNESLNTERAYVHYERTRISDHGPARNALATRMLGDWLIQLDTDHQFDPDVVQRLVDSANKYEVDVLSGLYVMKSEPHCPVAYAWVGDGLQPIATWSKEARLIQIGSAGGGCLFVRRRVFDRIHSELGEEPFDRKHPFSEDHSFFVRLKALGIPAYLDTTIRYDHLRIAPVTLDDCRVSDYITSEPMETLGYG